MKEAIVLFKRNRATVEAFLRSTIELNNFEEVTIDNYTTFHSVMPFLELVYMVDNSYRQITDYYYRSRIDSTTKGGVKNYLFNKAQVKKNEIFISNPYISSHTGNACITVVKSNDIGYIIFDFNLYELLEQMLLLERNSTFTKVSKFIYSTIGFSLMAFSFILVIYAAYSFVYHLVTFGMEEIGMIFTPIIALTLGLAIFDLSRTILEQEVFYKSHAPGEDLENKVLTKFLITIIIALSIESLMVVFKIALSDYSKMLNAFYLISGVSLMIFALGLFRYFTRKAQRM